MTTEKRRIAWLKIAKRIEIESTVSNEKKCTIPIVTQKETNTSEHTYVAKIEENEDGYIVTIKNKEEINQ